MRALYLIRRFMAACLLAGSFAAVTAPEARPQAPTASEAMDAPTPGADESRADVLRAEARSMPSVPKNWRRIRTLYQEAARYAGPQDPQRSEDLRLAGLISTHLGDLEQAEHLLVQAAQTARDFGDVYHAAHAYADAAIVAAQLGDADRAYQLLDCADRLSRSPLLEPPFCDCIRERIAKLAASVR
jgi:tetratricopeptide (TPR) repeat protein